MAQVDEIYDEGARLRGGGDFEAAASKFQEGLALDADHALTHLALAMTYVPLNQFDLVEQHGRRACELEPNDAQTFTAMSVAYQRAWAASGDQRFIKMAEDARDRANMIAAQSQA